MSNHILSSRLDTTRLFLQLGKNDFGRDLWLYRMKKTRGVLIFRLLVFVLVALYFSQTLSRGVLDPFGGGFRFLTNWGQTFSLIVAALMLGRSLGWTRLHPDTLVSVTVVLNAMVLFLYWSLFFRDPALVNGDGPIIWWREYYIHLAGPVLQMLDALLIFGCFRHMRRILPMGILIFLVYVMWIEAVLRPLQAAL